MTNVKLQVNCLLAVVRKCTFAVTFVWQIDRKPNGYSVSVLSNTFCYQQTCSLISQNYCLPIICDQAVKTREFKISYCYEFQNLRRSFAVYAEFKTNYHQKICIRNLLPLITFIIIHARDKLLISKEIDSGVDHLTFVGLVECF